MKHVTVTRFVGLFLCSSLLVACGAEEGPELVPTPNRRDLLERASERARYDSSLLADSEFTAIVEMVVEVKQEEQDVLVNGGTALRKDLDSGYVTEPLHYRIEGDSTLLQDMYTFEDARGNLRSPQGAHIGGLDFGTDFLRLVDRILESPEGMFAWQDAWVDIGEISCWQIDFSVDDRFGRFWLDRDSLSLVRLEVEQGSDYLVGSYHYRVLADYGRPSNGPLLPMRSTTDFTYGRLFTEGTGRVEIVLSDVLPRSDRSSFNNENR